MLIDPSLLIIGGGVVLVGAIAANAIARERRRRAAYEEFCRTRGFGFETERPGGERRYQGTLEYFTQGRSRRWGYTINGRRADAPFTAFEYRWVTGGGKNSSTHRIAGIVWERDGAALPGFALTPEGWLSRVGDIFGMQDIDFAESPEFSRAYRLRGPDDGAIRAAFTPELRHFFAVTPDQHVAGGGTVLIWWRSGRLPPAARLDEWLEEGDRVRRRFFKS